MDAQLSYRLSSLSTAKRRLILRRLLDLGHAVETLPIPRDAAIAPIQARTFDAQDRLLTLESLRPGTMYNRISLALLLHGTLDDLSLQLALNDLCVRHEGLRTSFVLRGGHWHQIVADRLYIDLTIVDLVDLPATARDPQIEQHRDRFESQPLNLETGPLWRTMVLRVSEQAQILLLCLHHAIADGWSVDVLARDLSYAYRARLKGLEPTWLQPALQPREYAQFLNDLDACAMFNRREESGPAELQPALGVTCVPADLIRPQQKTDYCGVVTWELDSAQLDALRAVARQERLTLAAIYTTGALIALGEFAGEQDLLVAFALANRDHAETHDLVAPLVGIVPLRVAVDFSEALHSLASRVQREIGRLSTDFTIAGRDEDAAAAVMPSDLRCLLVVQNTNQLLLDLPDIQIQVLPQRRAGAFYDLTIVFHSLPGGCRVSVEYAEDLFIRGTAEQLAGRIAVILRAMAIDGKRPIVEATRPSHAEALGYLAPYKAIDDQDFAAPIKRICQQASTRPNATAIDAPGGGISYAELLNRAASLARALSHGSAGDARPIAIITTDGAPAALGMMAAHLAHSPFVVLDPRSAPARRMQMLKACRARAVLFDDTGAAAASEICNGGEVAAMALQDVFGDERPPAAPAAEDPPVSPKLAYIAFTSGSTGEPKGIVQSEAAFGQFLQWQEETFELGPDSRVAMWSSLAFDACYTEVFGALIAGATLCVPHAELRRDPRYVVDWIERLGITYLLTVPSFLTLLVSEIGRGGRKLASLRDVAVSGEVLAPDLCSRFHQCLPSARLHNLFGPTEAVLASYRHVAAPWPERVRVPVGYPIAGRQILLADQLGRPVARGAIGEINIVSSFLTEGYLANGTVTQFPPFGQNDSRQRVYRTGDYGRIAHTGDLHFLGRRDGQVKIRGVRIMIDEIESVLARHPEVGSCAVVDHATDGSVRQLVAFIVPASDAPVLQHVYEQAPRKLQVALRTSALASVDQFAVPAFFIMTAQLPRTASGKVDYLALRDIDPGAVPAARSPAIAVDHAIAPDLVSRIRDAWKSVLPATLNDDDNFFDIGGDSIAAVRLHTALEHACPGMFGLADIYANPSIVATCEAVRLRGEETAISEGAQRALQRRSARTRLAMNERNGDSNA